MAEPQQRIRTTHVGSLPRPPELEERLADSSTGELADDEADASVLEATADVLRQQLDCGLDVVNNGELARTGFHTHLTDRLDGFGDPAPAPFWRDVEAYPELAETKFRYPDADPETGAPRRPAVIDAIEYGGTGPIQRELDVLFDALEEIDSDAEIFVTAPSPGIVATSLPDRYYGSHEEYLFAVADALRQEYAAIGETDATLQIDAPDLMHTFHRSFYDGRDFTDLSAEEYADELLPLHVEAINEALARASPDRVRLHTCWGNYEGPHHMDIDLATVLPRLYDLEIDALGMELTGPRHDHEYEAFAEYALPDSWDLLPGVLDVKTSVIEHPETVAHRLERIASVVDDPRRVVAAPNCGFGTLAHSSADYEITWAKLDALIEGADIASDRLF